MKVDLGLGPWIPSKITEFADKANRESHRYVTVTKLDLLRMVTAYEKLSLGVVQMINRCEDPTNISREEVKSYLTVLLNEVEPQ